ncbi:MAG: squalene/phytoene synthase family protein, partial [Chthoniobacterales bacterium]
DTAGIPTALRLTNLRLLGEVIAGEKTFAAIAESLHDFARHQTNPAERTLLENVDQCTDHLAQLSAADREDIRAVLATIVQGQTLDVERFGDPDRLVSLQTAAELEEYTWLVAGCVGDFWTRLGFRHAAPFARKPPNEMTALGIEYGKGLQLINILRDRSADLRAGRNYFPAEEMATLPESEVFTRWLGKAEKQIAAGLDYCLSLTNWRLRFATALPALIGARTLALVRAAGAGGGANKIKVSRQEVRRMLAMALLAAASPHALRALFERLGTERELAG